MVIKKNLPNICRTPITNHGERSRGNGLDDLREILGFFFGTRTSPTGNGASSDGWHTPPWNPRFRGPTCIETGVGFHSHNLRSTTNTTYEGRQILQYVSILCQLPIRFYIIKWINGHLKAISFKFDLTKGVEPRNLNSLCQLWMCENQTLKMAFRTSS